MTNEDILSVSDVSEKAIVLTGVSSGLAANEIVNLRVGELQFDDINNVITIKIRRLNHQWIFKELVKRYFEAWMRNQ